MRLHECLLLRPAVRWLVGCATVSLLVLVGASGDDVFARHVGMSVSAMTTHQAEVGGDGPTAPSAVRDDGRAPSAAPSHVRDGERDAAHVMHLVGACLAILCAGAMLLRGRGSWLASVRAMAGPGARLVFPASWLAGVRRGPPPLTPPRFSPVIRT
jgi:hypothetical protein